ncbi:hypothetical protein KR49_13075 [Synechococcus sp. KORDI-49]|nr:hypothetical protein KR49_13075 [Synechococcus sp. KORDI-49]
MEIGVQFEAAILRCDIVLRSLKKIYNFHDIFIVIRDECY